MNRYRTIALIALLAALQIAYSQDRKYQRKTITTVETILTTNPQAEAMKGLIVNRLNATVKLSRFDYQFLPAGIESDFIRAAKATDLSPASVGSAMNNTVLKSYSASVGAKGARANEENMTDVEKQSALRQKQKEAGATSEQIVKAMNAAYVYIPVITSYKEESAKDQINASIEGYILWYRLATAADGTSKLVLHNPNPEISKGEGSGKPGTSYKLKNRQVDGAEYARVLAVDAWAKNLSLDMRRNPEFRLSGEIAETKGDLVRARIGSREGISADEGFNLVDFFENDKGEVESKNLGFFRVASVGNNNPARGGDPQALSIFTNYIGSGYDRGMILAEHPRMGFDIALSARYITLKIPKTATVISVAGLISSNGPLGPLPDVKAFEALHSHPYLLKEDATSAVGVDLEFRYNLARMLGIRQLFMVLTLSGAFPMASLDANAAAGTSVVPLAGSGYVGIMKKLWFSRANLGVGVHGGVDLLHMASTTPVNFDLDNISIMAVGVKADLALEYLLSPDWTVQFGAGFKVGIKPISGSLQFKGDTKTYDLSPDLLLNNPFYKDLNFTGANFSFGISWALPSSSSNPFSGFEASEIDY